MARPFEGKIFTCKQCGKAFKRNNSQISKGRTKFCNRQCAGKSHTGVGNPTWKDGKRVFVSGYIGIWNGKSYDLEHRLVMEKYIGRKLKHREQVHHIDHNKTNNSISNLVILSIENHHKLHMAIRPKRFCKVCSLKHYCKGFCRKHYKESRNK